MIKTIVEKIKKRFKSEPTDISTEGLEFIASYESFVGEPYDDGYGNQTIGYGHVVKAGEHFESITEDEALILLRQDAQYWVNEVSKCSRERGVIWDQNEFDAFVIFAFNTGYDFEEVMDYIIAGEDPYAVFSKYIYSSGSKSLGLYRRRMDEADIFVNGTYNREDREWP